jgi:hypothetical protein
MANTSSSNRTPEDFASVFRWLRGIAAGRSTQAVVAEDSSGTYILASEVGPAMIKRKGPKAAGTTMQVTYVKIGKAYVSYHLVGIYMNPALNKKISAKLAGRMQGKACFNFSHVDQELSAELGALTEESIVALRKAGFII